MRCALGWGTCLLVLAGIGAAIGIPSHRAIQRRKENNRLNSMAEATGVQLSTLEESVWELDCDGPQSRFQAFRGAKDSVACQAAFEEFASQLNSTDLEFLGCSTGEADDLGQAASNSTNATAPASEQPASSLTTSDQLGSLAGQARVFSEGRPPKAKDSETHLSLTCEHPDKVNAITKQLHEGTCFEKGFNIEGQLDDFVNSGKAADCLGIKQTMDNFRTMADGSCKDPATTVALLEQCESTPKELIDAVKDLTRPDRNDNCYKVMCDLKNEIKDIKEVQTNGRRYYGMGMYYPLFWRTGPGYYGYSGRSYSKDATVSRKTGNSKPTKVTGKTNYGGGKPGGSGIRGSGVGRPGG